MVDDNVSEPDSFERFHPNGKREKRLRVRHLHLAGKWSTKDALRQERVLDRVRQKKVSLYDTTEDKTRFGKVKAPGFAGSYASDAAVFHDVSDWKRLKNKTVRARFLGLKYYKPVACPLEVLEHKKTKARLVHGAIHMPIDRRGARDWVRGKVLYPAIIKAAAKEARRLAREHDAEVMINFDANKNLLAPDVRRWFLKKTKLRVSVPRDYKGAGTGPTGHLVIDGALISDGIEVEKWDVLIKDASSDHAPVLTVLSLPIS